MWKIRRFVLESVVQAAINTYPDEFVSLLGGDQKKQEITELIVLPAIYGSEHAIIRSDLLPWSVKALGSVHSHPGYSNYPSRADKRLFSAYGNVHLIICLPFSIQSIRAFNEKGTPIPFEGIK